MHVTAAGRGTLAVRRIATGIAVAGALIAWAPQGASAQATHPTPASPPPGHGHTPGAAAQTFQYELDLALPPGDLPTLSVPAGQRVDVSLIHASLPATYRVTEGDTGLDRPHGSPPRELPSRVFEGTRSMPARVCPAAAEPAWAALVQEQDEARLQRAVEVLRAAAGSGQCRDMAENLLVNYTRRPLNSPHQMRAGLQHRVTVERLGADGKATRKWSVVFTPGRAEAGWEYPTEQATAVGSIVQDLSELTAFAAGSGAPGRVKVTLPVLEAPDKLRVEVPLAGAPLVADLAIAPHVWAPELYADVTSRLLASRKLRATSEAPGGSSLLAALSDLKAEILLREARRVSERLTKVPLDARAHEEASILWGAFGLRESNGPYSDRRPALSRAAAHLAFARGLRAGRPASREGAWAAILISTLAGRSREAIERLDALGAPSDAERPWLAALRVRNDVDWRKIESPGTRTLLEQLEFVRAKEAAIDGLSALAALDEVALPPVPDWGRILLWTASVEEGRRFGPAAIPLELRELALAHGVAAELSADLQRASELMSRRDTPIVRRATGASAAVEVLGPAAWSAAASRNLIGLVEFQDRFLEHSLGMPNEAVEFRNWVRPLIQVHPLFPLVEWRRLLEKGGRPAPETCGLLSTVATRTPFELPARYWVVPVENWCSQGSPFPPARSFFDPPVPTGTTLDVRPRLVAGAVGMAVTSAHLKGFRDLAPQNSALVFASLSREYRGAIPVEVVAQEYGHFAEYQVSAGRMALESLAKDPVAYRRMAEKMCALGADHCWTLGAILVNAGEEDAAAVVYQRAVEQGLDRVAASNRAGWLVEYYERKGQPDRALEIARMGESTGSSRGYLTMARLLERRGRLEEAEKRYLANKERYDDARELNQFYLRARNKAGGERWSKQADAAMKELFPKGLERLPANPSGPPAAGAVLTDPSEALLKAGIRPGDVVVGLDGYVVKDPHHYGDVKALNVAPEMKLTVWHDGRYVEVVEKRDRINYFRQ